MAVKKHFLKKRNPLFRLNQVRRNARIARIKKQRQMSMDRNALFFIVQNSD